jgi:hypothetical protein
MNDTFKGIIKMYEAIIKIEKDRDDIFVKVISDGSGCRCDDGVAENCEYLEDTCPDIRKCKPGYYKMFFDIEMEDEGWEMSHIEYPVIDCHNIIRYRIGFFVDMWKKICSAIDFVRQVTLSINKRRWHYEEVGECGLDYGSDYLWNVLLKKLKNWKNVDISFLKDLS